MQVEKDNESFHFTYSAREQEELEKIRQKYQPPKENKMDKLRRMDAQVTRKAMRFSLTMGVMGTLIMGSGMSLSMTQLGEDLGFGGAAGMLIGIVVGVLGIVLICLAYPLYNYVLKKERRKIAPEMLRLTEELMG